MLIVGMFLASIHLIKLLDLYFSEAYIKIIWVFLRLGNLFKQSYLYFAVLFNKRSMVLQGYLLNKNEKWELPSWLVVFEDHRQLYYSH